MSAALPRLALALAAGGTMLALALRLGASGRLVPALVLATFAIAAAAVDLRRRIIPNTVNGIGAACVLASSVAAQPDRTLEFLIAGVAAFALFLVLWAVRPSGLGLGDVKMAPMLGFGLGSAIVPGLFLASLAAALAAVAILVLRGAAARRAALPFGPFLALGAVAALLLSP